MTSITRKEKKAIEIAARVIARNKPEVIAELELKDKNMGRKFELENGSILTIDGISRIDRRNAKIYKLSCSKCSLDSELFPDGSITSALAHLFGKNVVKPRAPCLCSISPTVEMWQREIIAKRSAIKMGVDFIGFVGKWTDYMTKVSLRCSLHGEWHTNSYNNLVHHQRGCPECGKIRRSNSKRTPQDEVERRLNEICLRDGCDFVGFVDGKYKSAKGKVILNCKEHGDWTTSCYAGIHTEGARCPSCSGKSQKYAYLHSVSDDSGVFAVKFGITRRPKFRLHEQNRKSRMNVDLLGLWKFGLADDCRLSESTVKKSLKTKVVSKSDLPDGYSETIEVCDVDKVIKIYESHGGIRVN